MVVMQPLVLSFDETASSADLGGSSSKYANEIYIQKLLSLSVWICQTIFEAQVKTPASILIEWI